MKIWVLTLSWNGEEKLKKLQPTLLPALNGLDWQWLIKDNGSKDNTLQTIANWGNDKITVFDYKNNTQNFSKGMNYLFHQATPADDDLILFMNNDVMVTNPKSIHNMMKLLENDSVGAVGARLLYTDTNKLQHAGVVFNNHHQLPIHFRINEKTDAHAERNRYFQVVTGAVLLTKAKYFKEACKTNKSGIVGMDENYHWAFDDVDFCLSINYNLEKKIVYCGNTEFFHEESATLKKNPANKLFMPHNVNYLKNKWSKRISLDQDIYIRDAHYQLYK